MRKDINGIETTSYGRNYSESAFWRVARKVGSKVAYPALLLLYELMDSDVPLRAKAEVVGALGYFIAPFDLIPDGIPVLGYTDDFAALSAMVSLTMQYITPRVKRQAKAKLRDWFGDCDGYEDVA